MHILLHESTTNRLDIDRTPNFMPLRFANGFAALMLVVILSGCNGSDGDENSSGNSTDSGNASSSEGNRNNDGEQSPSTAADSANESEGEEDSAADANPEDEGSSVESMARNWAHFRGGQSANGRAGGKLGDNIELKWEYRLEKGGFLGAPLIVDGVVFAVDMDGQAVAVSLETGKEIWSVDLDSFVDASPAIVEDKLIVGDLDGNLFCLLTTDGSEVWKKTLETSFITSVNEFDGDIVAVGETGLMTRLDLATGETKWEFTVEDRILSSPSIADSQCFLTGCASKLYEITLDEPSIESARELAAPTGVTAAIDGDLAYFSLSGGTMMCVNWKTGEEVWSQFDPMGDQEGSSCPAIGDDRVVIGGGSTRNVVGYDRNSGEKKWSFTTRRMVNGSPIIVGNDVVIGGNDGRVYVLTLGSGDLKFEYEVGGAAAAAPAAVGSEFVVANDKGAIYCFQGN